MKNPLNEAQTALGAVFGMDTPHELPASYGDPAEEHRAVRQAAGLIDRSGRGLLRFVGSDRVEYLNNMLTNDLKALIPGSGCYAAATTEKAKLLADLRITCLTDSLFIDLEPTVTEKIQKHLDKYIITSDVTIENNSETLCLLLLSGPKSPEILTAVFPGVTLPEKECGNIETDLSGRSVLIIRNEITGEIGFDLFVPKEAITGLWNTLIQEGKPFGMKPAGLRALESLRIEAGIPVYGVDMDESHFPMEAGIEKRAISYTKGCYMGQETIARTDAHGHMNRRLMGLELTVDQLPIRGTAIIGKNEKGEKEIGSITSAIFSPTLKKSIAMGYVHKKFMEVGSTVAIQGKRAVVTELPFYHRKPA